MEASPALQPLCVDAQFMALILTFPLGQHVTLDIILPPYGARPPTASTTSPHPQASLVMDYLNMFHGQWPMPVYGRMVDRLKVRLTFCHLLFPPLTRHGSVNHLWTRTTLHRAKQLAHINLQVPRGLPAAYALVDSIIWHDSESELHSQTDSEILRTPERHHVKPPFRERNPLSQRHQFCAQYFIHRAHIKKTCSCKHFCLVFMTDMCWPCITFVQFAAYAVFVTCQCSFCLATLCLL